MQYQIQPKLTNNKQSYGELKCYVFTIIENSIQSRLTSYLQGIGCTNVWPNRWWLRRARRGQRWWWSSETMITTKILNRIDGEGNETRRAVPNDTGNIRSYVHISKIHVFFYSHLTRIM